MSTPTLNFPCTGCGMCCMQVAEAIKNAKALVKQGAAPEFIKEIADFPYNTKPDGSCENLLPDHKCAVYLSRPDCCDVEKTWQKHHLKTITKKKYFVETAELCNSFITEAKLDDKFLINPKLIM